MPRPPRLGLFAYPALMAADILSTTPRKMARRRRTKKPAPRALPNSGPSRPSSTVTTTWTSSHHRAGESMGAATRRDETCRTHEEDVQVDPSDHTAYNLTDDADTSRRRSARPRPTPNPLPDALDGLESRPEARKTRESILRGHCDVAPQAVLDDFNFCGALSDILKVALADLARRPAARISAEITGLMPDPAESTASSPRREGARKNQRCRSSSGPYDIVGMLAKLKRPRPGPGGVFAIHSFEQSNLRIFVRKFAAAPQPRRRPIIS